jgi:hypothetical protein
VTLHATQGAVPAARRVSASHRAQLRGQAESLHATALNAAALFSVEASAWYSAVIRPVSLLCR